ncbi:MAG: hypothetical protein WCV72_02635 [Patescibacteria group bacterium]|jgi:hypothetical protein
MNSMEVKEYLLFFNFLKMSKKDYSSKKMGKSTSPKVLFLPLTLSAEEVWKRTIAAFGIDQKKDSG